MIRLQKCMYTCYRVLGYTTLNMCRKSVSTSSFMRLSSNLPTPINVSFTDPAVIKYLEHVKCEYWSLYSSESVDKKSQKRLKELLPIVKIMEQQECINDNLKNLEEMSENDAKDPEMIQLVKEEQKVYSNILASLNTKLFENLITNSIGDDYDNTVLEVTAGVGGQEAMLFARELFDMYCGYMNFKNWDYQIAQLDTSELGGIRHASVLVTGNSSYNQLKHEAGVHRVQRIPSTEKAGRIHTSTVTVAVLPQPDEIDIVLNSKDIRMETKRASGAGGQHVNTTDSAVRLVHIPSGLAVECQTERAQFKNKEIAMQRLKAKLFEQQMETQQLQTKGIRKSQVGSSLRNEKIRTYNFNQDRITDHRLAIANNSGSANYHNIKVFLLGGEHLDSLIQSLDLISRTELLQLAINNINKDQK